MNDLPCVLISDLERAVAIWRSVLDTGLPQTNMFGMPLACFYYAFLYEDGRTGNGMTADRMPVVRGQQHSIKPAFDVQGDLVDWSSLP
jgi:catechol 2,3-dioxygenase-like lactoylglutathione lyase family enzyme